MCDYILYYDDPTVMMAVALKKEVFIYGKHSTEEYSWFDDLHSSK